MLRLNSTFFISVTSHIVPVCKSAGLMFQSIPTGYISPGQPPEIFFEQANPGHPAIFFCLIPCPGAKTDGRIPRVGQNSPKLEETAF